MEWDCLTYGKEIEGIQEKNAASAEKYGTEDDFILVNAFNCRFQLWNAAMRSLVILCRRQLFAFVDINTIIKKKIVWNRY